MEAQDLHEVVFEWPHPEPTTVIATGTFDEWSSSIHLAKTPTGFVGSTKIPWGEKIKFKYVVDGQWLLHEDQSTEMDPGGFVNHTYTAPAAPVNDTPFTVPIAEPAPESSVNGNGSAGDNPAETETNGVANTAEQAEKAIAEVDAVAHSELKIADASPAGLPQLLSNIADTIAARDGTSSALNYVASGLGAAIHNVVGVDPINTQQIAIPTPVADAAFALPGEQESAPNSAALPVGPNHATAEGSLPSPIAPIVPILIVPVNAAENNTVATSPQTEREGEVTAVPEVVDSVIITSAAEELSTTVPVQQSDEVVAPEAQGVTPDVPTQAVIAPVVEANPEESVAVVEAAVEGSTLAASEPEPVVGATIGTVTAEEQALVGDVDAPPIIVEATTTAPIGESPVEEKDDENLLSESEAVIEAKDSAVEQFVVAQPVVEDLSAIPTIEPTAAIEDGLVAAPVEPITAVEETVIVAPVESAHAADEAIAVAAFPLIEETVATVEIKSPAAADPAIVIPVDEEQQPTSIPIESDAKALPSDEVYFPTVANTPAVAKDVQEEPIVAKLDNIVGEPVLVIDNLPTPEETVVRPADHPETVAAVEPTSEAVTSKETNLVTQTVPQPEIDIPAAQETLDDIPPGIESEAKDAQVVVDRATLMETSAVVAEPVANNNIEAEAEVSPIILIEPADAPDASTRHTSEVPVADTPSVPKAEIAPQEALSDDVLAPTEVEVTPKVADIIPPVVSDFTDDRAVSQSHVITENISAEESATVPEVVKVTAETSSTNPVSVIKPFTESEPVQGDKYVEPEQDSNAAKKPTNNGHSDIDIADSSPTFPSTIEAPVAPTDNSPSSSKVNTMRKKRTSIFGKLKNIFHNDKDKEKK